MTGQEIIAQVMRASSHRFIGRLGGDPEIKFFESGNCVASASMAVNRPGAKKDDGQAPDWFKVEVWGEQAQAFADQCRKGNRIDVMGRVKTNRWTTQGGEERTDLIVTVDAWKSLEAPQPPVQKAAESMAQATAGEVVDDLDEDDIPF
jgi:single-strand DNA-binding protein